MQIIAKNPVRNVAPRFLLWIKTVKHFGPEPTQVLNSVITVLLRQETATWGGLDLGSAGVWEGDYGWGVRVRRPFGARGRSSVRYGTRLGDLQENWFLLFSKRSLMLKTERKLVHTLWLINCQHKQVGINSTDKSIQIMTMECGHNYTSICIQNIVHLMH